MRLTWKPYESSTAMSQTPSLLLNSGKTAIEEEAEARGVDSRLFRQLLGLRQDGSSDSDFVSSAIESAVQRELEARFRRSSFIEWELCPACFGVKSTKVTLLTVQKKHDLGSASCQL